MLLLGGAHKKYNLSSLKVIRYGAEPMPAMTLALVNRSFKNIKIQQTYGMIEIGVLRSKSKSNDSLWLKLGGEGYKLRIVDGMLQVKTDSALLGYIGVDSPFTDDGYFITGDSVEQDGDWIRILGRKSELINVGGEKVYPAEVETIILENKKILDTVVYGSKNPLLGQIVSAKISINQKYKGNFNISDFKKECAKKNAHAHVRWNNERRRLGTTTDARHPRVTAFKKLKIKKKIDFMNGSRTFVGAYFF